MNPGKWQITAQSRRFRDPLRLIVVVRPGAGSDLLTMDCGHQQNRTHRHLWGRRTGCVGCREWEDQS